MIESDPYVGHVFLDLDPRSVGKRIRVISRRRSLIGVGYRAVRINAHGQEVSAHPLNLTQEQLENEYRRESTMGSGNRDAIAELRRAAGSIRLVVGQMRRRKAQGAVGRAAESAAVVRAMGFSRPEQALAVAAVLEETSDEAWLRQEVPSELVLVVARIVNAVEVR